MSEDVLMDLEVARRSGGAAIVTIRGELDVSNAHRVKAALAALGDVALTAIDLRDVSFIDSTGLNAIALYGRNALRRDASLYVVVTNPAVRKIFAITKLDDCFPIVESLEELQLF
ncbi:MAG TPA: STAS domain-containing protein [Candidatus Baltobacteraceae bacterium]|jgi:anti-anti-sigma factor|nr:STAS domain-containing protein [Candidatus Baltobacteraceae bacterium]